MKDEERTRLISELQDITYRASDIIGYLRADDVERRVRDSQERNTFTLDGATPPLLALHTPVMSVESIEGIFSSLYLCERSDCGSTIGSWVHGSGYPHD